MRDWARSPHHGGMTIPKRVQAVVRERVLDHAEKNYAGKYTRIAVRFRGKFCYMDAYTEPYLPEGVDPGTGETREEYLDRLRSNPIHLCRIRYYGDIDNWGVAFFTYSHMKYEETFFGTSDPYGTPEEAFDVGAVYLQDR